MSGGGGGHTLRSLESLEDYRACVDLQEEVWGRGFSERVPMAILKVGQRLGGVSAGAFDESGRLDGFVFGLTGLDADGALLHWSDMLAVRRGVEGRGLGVRLKAFQRDAVLRRDVLRMAWTFDPLRARNAYLNLTKLGAVIREYREDMYGQTDSELHRGIGTDRFVALWLLDSTRVRERLDDALAAVARKAAGQTSPDHSHAPPYDGGGPDPSALVAEGDPSADLPAPSEPRLGLDAPRVTVAIPEDIGLVMDRAPELAVRWREATRAVFQHYLGRGYEVRELERAPPGRAHATYLMEQRRVGESAVAPPYNASTEIRG